MLLLIRNVQQLCNYRAKMSVRGAEHKRIPFFHRRLCSTETKYFLLKAHYGVDGRGS